MQPPNVDMSLIREALMRRMAGGGMGSGSPMPMAQQMTPPSGQLPGGGANVPAPQPQPMPAPQVGQIPAQGRMSPEASATPMQKMAGVAQTAQGMPDDETRNMAKALVGKLIKYL